ncbi:MAG: filamentous hemagglutinin family protein [Chthoniobacterales bacterium]
MVEPGAELSTSVNAEGSGGRVVLVGPNVRNAGRISTPAGQTILAAGMQVGFQAHASSDPSLRGLDVFVGDIGTYGGSAENTGVIDVGSGNLTMVGRSVQQQGIAQALTTVALNGRIDLNASYNAVRNADYDPVTAPLQPAFLNRTAGDVTVGAGSVTQVLPDLLSAATTIGTTLPLRSQINVTGNNVVFGASSIVRAPSGDIKVMAGDWRSVIESVDGNNNTVYRRGEPQFVYATGSVRIDNDALIDVSGVTDVFMPLSQSILNVVLRGSELATSPLLRDSSVRGLALTVDIRRSDFYLGRYWIGTPLGDATGFANIIERTAAQMSAAGGTISIKAGGSVTAAPGSVLDVSGGTYINEAGMVSTSRLVLPGSGLIDVADATPDLSYSGLYSPMSTQSSDKWGVSKTYRNPLAPTGEHYEAESISGAAGGSLDITAPVMSLAGTLTGETVAGPQQLRPVTQAADQRLYSQLPALSTLRLSFTAQSPENFVGVAYPTVAPSPVSITFSGKGGAGITSGEGSQTIAADFFATTGFGNLEIDSGEGDVQVASGVTVNVPAGGSLAIKGRNFDVNGSIVAPGGKISLTASPVSPYQAAILKIDPASTAPSFNPAHGSITLGASSVLSTAGLLVDDLSPAPTGGIQPYVVDGGSIELVGFNVRTQPGSRVDVSGGLAVSGTGAFRHGAAGTITIAAGNDPSLPSLVGGRIELGGDLAGYSGLTGGTLEITAPLVQVGGAPLHDTSLVLSPDFFTAGGFTQYNITGLGVTPTLAELNARRVATGDPAAPDNFLPAVWIAPGTQIQPSSEVLLYSPFNRRTGGAVLERASLPVGLRTPASVTFNAPGVVEDFAGNDAVTGLAKNANDLKIRGDILVDAGSTVTVDPLGHISLSGQTVTVLGGLTAPGGQVSISGAKAFPSLEADPTFPRTTVYLGPDARVSAAGAEVVMPRSLDPLSRRRGSVVPGGSVEIAGNILASSGAVLDVSGARGILDLTPRELGVAQTGKSAAARLNTLPLQRSFTPTVVASDGGTLTLEGRQMLVNEATMLGRAGGPSAAGGSLEVSSGRFYLSTDQSTSADANLLVTQTRQLALSPTAAQGIGFAVRDPAGAPIQGQGYFSVDQMAGGGFASLKLGGNPDFRGSVAVAVTGSLDVGSGGVIRANSDVRLQGSYIKLGQAFLTPLLPTDTGFLFTKSDPLNPEYTFAPASGPGRLIAEAPFIDVGTLSLENISQLELHAPGGSIRGNGTVQIAGSMLLEAAQVYPTTAATFGLYAYDTATGPGSVSFVRAGDGTAPLSAAGTLNVQASIISQGGTLLAPFGRIRLGWDGTGTAPVNPIAQSSAALPVTQSLTVSPSSLTSVSGLDPTTGAELLIPYGVSFDGLNWIDPAGQNITDGSLLPGKEVSLAGRAVDVQAGSVIDLRGGGDIYAYQWVEGNGGPIDLLSPNPQYQDRNYQYGTTGSFAVLPSYSAPVAPYAPFNTSSKATSLDDGSGNRDPGYVHNDLNVGDRVYLEASPGLAAGYYTLLPARYALMPGAFMVTPMAGAPNGSYQQSDGSSMVAGYRLNGTTSRSQSARLHSAWEVVPSEVLAGRSEYTVLRANEFLPRRAAELGLSAVARLPQDSAYLRVVGSDFLRFDGGVLARPVGAGRGAWADLASRASMTIIGQGQAASGPAVLNATRLSDSGIESLLVGGTRTDSTVQVLTPKITVDNAGSPLQGPDVILAASKEITLKDGAQAASSGAVTAPAQTLNVAGNGALLRISSDAGAVVARSGVTADNRVLLSVGAGASVTGSSVTADSSYGFHLDPEAVMAGSSIAFGAGQISLLLDGATTLVGQLDPLAPQLALSGSQLALAGLANRVTFRTYQGPVDLYGPGTFGSAALGSLTFETSGLRGFNQAAGTTTLQADSITLGNPNSLVAVGGIAPTAGNLDLQAGRLTVAAGKTAISQFQNVLINAPGGILFSGQGGLSTEANLTANTSALAATSGSAQSLTAGGNLILNDSGTAALVASGVGGSLALRGAGVTANSDILLPSGVLELAATGTGGDLIIGGRLDASGTSQAFYDVVRYTDAGRIVLSSAGGNVSLLAGSVVAVNAPSGGGDAGSLKVSTPQGAFSSRGLIEGRAGTRGTGGVFDIDAQAIADFNELGTELNAGGFTEARNFRVRSGSVTISGLHRARDYRVSLDQGNLLVDGTIDASGTTGGSIALMARGDVTLAAGSVLDASASRFSTSGQGGQILLEAGSAVGGAANTSGRITIADDSTIDLRVDDYVAGSATTPGSSAFDGRFTGTLHLRAPRTGGGAGTGIGINNIQGDILGASSILAEGFKIYQAPAGTITTAIQSQINSEANTYLGAAGTASANYNNMMASILAGQPGLANVFVLAPGAEIVNTAANGDLVLGTSSSTSTSDWNLATFRYGPKRAPGVLTLRAPRDIIFNNALSDGFTPTTTSANGSWLWLAPLSQIATALPLNTQSWSYRLTAGADLSAADYREVLPADLLTSGFGGSLRLGKNYGSAVFSSGTTALTSAAVNNRYQVIRTGTGDIDISAGGKVTLLNQFSSIYTAGVRIADYASIYTPGDFYLPTILDTTSQGELGAAQRTAAIPSYVQYSMAGGDVRISAGLDLDRTTSFGSLVVDDSSRQLPSNWLYRRGFVDEATGLFGTGGYVSGPIDRFGDPASTTWWVDFSNFFAGIGALGGGDILLEAGRDVRNMDASIPTSARAPAGKPDASLLHELGGGDLTVRAGRNIDAGVYYVESGTGVLSAGGEILTNPTRSPTLGIIANGISPELADPLSWLPTTLFVGKSSFDVSARGDVLLGPVANAFLLPVGINNRYWNKSYFSTYDEDSGVTVTSLGGDITHRSEAQLPQQGGPRPLLALWAESQQLLNNSSAAWYQPWLRLSETSLLPFDNVVSTLPGSLVSTAFAGSINLVGDLKLFPSPVGTIELLASQAINGLQPAGYSGFVVPGQSTLIWQASTINLSDAPPARLPGVANPLSATAAVGRNRTSLIPTTDVFGGFQQSLSETGSYAGANASAQTQQALHAASPLHAGAVSPARLYAGTGNIEGLTLFSAKSARVFAGKDVADVALYLQNVGESDVSIVASGRDILPYTANGGLRALASQPGSVVLSGPMAGDIQISGPGSLQVLAGRTLDLGTGPNNADGTGTGITSIGNLRNPALPFEGAAIFAAAGLGPSTGLGAGGLNTEGFLATYGAGLGSGLSAEQRSSLALSLLFDVLKGTAAEASATGSYDAAYAAIATLFGSLNYAGDIITHSREIKTRTGAPITVLAPGGGVTMAANILGKPLAPPGIVTEYGGEISILTEGDVDIGKGRIFTLRGGDITIWSSTGDIAAGTAAKTVVTAPPTRVLVDAFSASVETDLAGLATGGGIGVLASVEGVPPGTVTLLAPVGTVDAGDAGIRATGDITIAAAQVLNADNISAGGTTVGAPSAPVAAAPNVSALSAGATSSAATSSAAGDLAQQSQQGGGAAVQDQAASIVTVEVLGYGGGEGSEEKKKDGQTEA